MDTGTKLAPQKTENTGPRIYVACLAAYNNGCLHGRWIDADQEESAIWSEIAAILKASPIPEAEEWAIHDDEGFEDDLDPILSHQAAHAAVLNLHAQFLAFFRHTRATIAL